MVYMEFGSLPGGCATELAAKTIAFHDIISERICHAFALIFFALLELLSKRNVLQGSQNVMLGKNHGILVVIFPFRACVRTDNEQVNRGYRIESCFLAKMPFNGLKKE